MTDYEQIEQKANKKSLRYNTKYSEDRELKDMLSRPQDFVEGAIEGIVNLLRQKAYRDGYIDGANAFTSVWHDLRKNPLDLPTENCTVLIYTDWQGMELKTFFVDTRLFENLTFREVIAWAEIPQFEGE